ncbi:hypothetical protein OG883_44140 [Streptomyces sp. NBC_01142]|uniref:hypothetical protein n=1 Tax=Streptomyces sp. NBC_01142 TaxID=2975865 RepID=UPI00224D5E25|nr:hypothetical protein [Streptomyces sp. NBC_01142]MCX4826634.1 hypothetical protein [Streptomyces sp. NBC_01142]
MVHRTVGDVVSAALSAHGYPAYPYEEGGVTALAVPLNPTVCGDDVRDHPHVLIASGESADRPVAEHDEPWSASLYEPDHEFVDVVFAGDPALSITEDARRCAAAVVDYAALWFAGRAPEPVPGSAQRLLNALRGADVAGFYDAEEGVVFAHPAHVPQDAALKGPHVLLQVFTASDGWPDGFSAVAWEPDGGADFHEVATVFESRGVASVETVDRGARAVAQWFAEPRTSAGAELVRALGEYGITPASWDNAYAVALDFGTPADDVWSSAHLSIADRTGSTGHVPAAHRGWVVFRHDSSGEPVGDPVFGAPATHARPDCATDSAHAAAFIADLLTAPANA